VIGEGGIDAELAGNAGGTTGGLSMLATVCVAGAAAAAGLAGAGWLAGAG